MISFRVGDHLLVKGEAGVDECKVLEIKTPDEMPDSVPGCEDGAQVRTWMREYGVDLLMLLEGRLQAPVPVAFFVLHTASSDEWRDLRGSRLKLQRWPRSRGGGGRGVSDAAAC